MAITDLTEKSFQPLDINTPVVDRIGRPTPAFTQQQRSFRKVLIAQSKATNAAIIQEGEVRAEADYANALLVDQVTAEALGFTAAVMMKMEVEIAPTGVLARYKIVASLDPGGDLVTTGMYFDIVEDLDNPGDYLGEITLDADRLKLGRADEAGMFPFYIDGGIVYIETAVIQNLSLGTEKLAPNSVTDLVVAYQGSAVSPGSAIVGTYVPGASASGDTGVLLQLAGFMDKPYDNPSNFGYWQLLLYRNGVNIAASPLLFYDDNFAYPVSMAFADTSPGANPYYEFTASGVSGLLGFTISGSTMLATLFKR
jgi:hypothetical protein